MFTITVTTFAGATKTFSIFDEDLAEFYYTNALKCLDVESVVMIDGFTGEVVNQVEHGEILVFDREIVVD